jgi:predicted PurR-regulated permease PerM
MKINPDNSSIFNVIFGGAGIFIIILGVKQSAPILNQFLLAFIIGITVMPVAGWMKRKGALLAVPLTMIVKDVFLDAYDETHSLSDLISADAPKQKPSLKARAN